MSEPSVTFTCAGCGKTYDNASYDTYEGWMIEGIDSRETILGVSFVPDKLYPALLRPIAEVLDVPFCTDNRIVLNKEKIYRYEYPCWLKYLETINSSEEEQVKRHKEYNDKNSEFRTEFNKAGGYSGKPTKPKFH